jgi:uncharacterized membrane protein (DUF2068 family)
MDIKAEDEALAEDMAMQLQLLLVLSHSKMKANRMMVNPRLHGAKEVQEMDAALVAALMDTRIGADS